MDEEAMSNRSSNHSWLRPAFGVTPALIALVAAGCSEDSGIPVQDDGGAHDGSGGGRSGAGGARGGTGGNAGAGGGHVDAGSGVGGSGIGGSGVGGSGGSRADAGGDGRADGGGFDAAPPLGGVVAAGVRWFGRVDTTTDPAHPRFSWSGSGFVARLSGTSLTAQLNNGSALIFKTVIDGAPQPAFNAPAGMGSYALATALTAGTHTVELYKQTEASQGNAQLLGLTVGGGALVAPPPGPQRLIEVVGDSISCGYGILGMLGDVDCIPTESHWDAYPSVTARALGAEVSTIAVSGRGVVRNYGGDTADTIPMIYGRALGNSVTPAWDFQIQPQAVVINLGTNDISNNKGDPGTSFRDTYLVLVETIRAHYPNAYILCTIGPLTSAAEAAIIQGHLHAVVQARAAAGDLRVESFDQIAPQTIDKAACQYHPNVVESALMAGQLAGELRAKLGW